MLPRDHVAGRQGKGHFTSPCRIVALGRWVEGCDDHDIISPHTPTRRGPVSATILVVDDDPSTLVLVERTLGAKGYRVWTAASAPKARQVLKELAGAVDLVLTDVAMPGGLGTDLAEQINSSQRWVRVLLMSAHSRQELLRQGLEIPEPSLLPKPFTPAQLLGRIAEALAD